MHLGLRGFAVLTGLLALVLATTPGGVAPSVRADDAASGADHVERDASTMGHAQSERGASRRAQREAALRSTLGFRSDPEFVQQLLDHRTAFDATPGEDTFGYHFTPDERQEFIERMALQRSGIAIGTYGYERAPDAYAGSWMDHEAGELVVGFRSGLDEHRVAALERVSDPARLRVVEVPFSRQQYQEMVELLAEADLHQRGVPAVSVAPRWREGLLEVGVDDPQVIVGNPAARERTLEYEEIIRAALPGRFDAVGIRFVEPEFGVGHDRAAYNPPLRGGVNFYMDRPDHSNGHCTSGFVTRRPNSSGGVQWGILTAGHCGYQATRVRWGDVIHATTVGFVLSSSWYDTPTTGLFTDTAYLHINSALRSRWFYKDVNRQAYAITMWIAPIEDEDYLVCMAGIRNPGAAAGNNCGTIYNASVNGLGPYYCGGTPNRCRRPINWVGVRGNEMACQGGDSGAPVHAGPEAWGIHYGSNPFTGNCLYTRIQYALNWHGLTGLETG